jgi:hypothetical protein
MVRIVSAINDRHNDEIMLGAHTFPRSTMWRQMRIAMPESTHASYLLRLWRGRASSAWRAMVIDVARPGEHQHFATLDALFAFLNAQTGSAPPTRHQQVNAPIEWEQNYYAPHGAPSEEPLD